MREIVIKSTTASLYAAPTIQSTRVDEALCGMRGQVLSESVLSESVASESVSSEDNNWLKIRMSYGYEGYIKKSCLCAAPEVGKQIETQTGPYYVVHAVAADVLAEPNVKAPLIQTMTTGCMLCLAPEHNPSPEHNLTPEHNLSSKQNLAPEHNLSSKQNLAPEQNLSSKQNLASEQNLAPKQNLTSKQNNAIDTPQRTHNTTAAQTSADQQCAAWRRVLLPDGQEGFMRAAFLKPAVNQPGLFALRDASPRATVNASRSYNRLRDRVLQTALSYRGAQYRWGGKSPLGIDCSGLCFMAYWLNGITIYRDAQIVPGYPVSAIPFEAAKKGDLLFFPGHVGLYLKKGWMLHASEADNGVRIVPLTADRMKKLLTAGSVFDILHV